MRNIMLVNPSGLSGHCMAIDFNIEHLIGYLKVSIYLVFIEHFISNTIQGFICCKGTIQQLDSPWGYLRIR